MVKSSVNSGFHRPKSSARVFRTRRRLGLPRGRCRGKDGILRATADRALLRAGGRALVLGLVGAACARRRSGSAFDLNFKVMPATVLAGDRKVRAAAGAASTQPAPAHQRTAAGLCAAPAAAQDLRRLRRAAPTALTEPCCSATSPTQRNDGARGDRRCRHRAQAGAHRRHARDYAQTNFVPTVKRVKHAEDEQLCLAQAIYHEARGERRRASWPSPTSSSTAR